jgi:hypothetical protein
VPEPLLEEPFEEELLGLPHPAAAKARPTSAAIAPILSLLA